jgi:hypothetical protein
MSIQPSTLTRATGTDQTNRCRRYVSGSLISTHVEVFAVEARQHGRTLRSLMTGGVPPSRGIGGIEVVGRAVAARTAVLTERRRGAAFATCRSVRLRVLPLPLRNHMLVAPTMSPMTAEAVVLRTHDRTPTNHPWTSSSPQCSRWWSLSADQWKPVSPDADQQDASAYPQYRGDTDDGEGAHQLGHCVRGASTYNAIHAAARAW